MSETGHRETPRGIGRVIHYRLGRTLLCRTNGANRQATDNPKDVNCLKCLEILKKIRA